MRVKLAAWMLVLASTAAGITQASANVHRKQVNVTAVQNTASKRRAKS